MTVEIDFVPFATGAGANVESQAAYIADPNTPIGQQAGTIAPSATCNKIWRQAVWWSAVIANVIANTLNINVLDDGNLAAAITNFTNMVKGLAWTTANLTNGSVAVTQTAGDNSTKIATTAFVQESAGMQVGDICWRGVNTPGVNELECNGASLSTTTYAALFAVYGYNWGGAGASFNLPDLRGYFIRAWDHSAGVDPGRAFGSEQSAANLEHNHLNGVSSLDATTQVYGATTTGIPGSATEVLQRQTSSPGFQGNTGESGDSESRPVNYALLPVVRYI